MSHLTDQPTRPRPLPHTASPRSTTRQPLPALYSRRQVVPRAAPLHWKDYYLPPVTCATPHHMSVYIGVFTLNKVCLFLIYFYLDLQCVIVFANVLVCLYICCRYICCNIKILCNYFLNILDTFIPCCVIVMCF